jgi:hypothetical protein
MSGFTDAAKHILGTVAPFITQATLGPLAPLANAALAKVFGVKADDPAAISAAVQKATPEQLLALQTENDSFKAQMAKIGFDEDKLVMDDRASARDMKVKTNDTTPRNLSYLLLVFTGAVILSILFGYGKVDSALMGSLVGYLVSENKAIMAFWFGSSSGSKSKDDTIGDLAKS